MLTVMMTLIVTVMVADINDVVSVLDYDGDNKEKLMEDREWM